jgi:predicted small lipoprotein YifL
MMQRSLHVVAAVLMLLGLVACGQTGPLYLPGDLPEEPAGEDDQGDAQDE